MIDPVISISVGFFVILCLLVKFTGVNDVTSDIVDNENTDNKDEDLTNIKSIEDIDTSKYDIIQTHYDLDAPIPGVTAFADGTLKTDVPKVDELSDDNKVYLLYKKDINNDIDQLSQLIEPIEDNIDIESEDIQKNIHHVLDFSAKEKDLIDLTGTTLISLKSIKQ